MNQGLMLLPCFSLIVLTTFMLYMMFWSRRVAVKAGHVSAKYFKTFDNGETLPRQARQMDRSFHNLLESTPLFYFISLATMALNKVDMVFIMLAWTYVGFRLIQCVIHITNNKIIPRSTSFVFGWITMLIMGGRLALLAI